MGRPTAIQRLQESVLVMPRPTVSGTGLRPAREVQRAAVDHFVVVEARQDAGFQSAKHLAGLQSHAGIQRLARGST